MGSPSCLTDPNAPLVIDTSAAINLIATGCAAEILHALPMRLVAVDAIPAELEVGRRRGRPDADRLAELVSARLVEIVALDEPAIAVFESLVIGPAADTLDDGEAATIAYAVGHSSVAIIDERKANRICSERFPALSLGCTVDILAHPAISKAIGYPELSAAVFNALQFARMRVAVRYIEWVVNTIGAEQAAQCPSLPRSGRMVSAKGE